MSSISMQLLVCVTQNNRGKLLVLETKNGNCKAIKEINVHIGLNGASEKIYEGSLMTPKGIFKVTQGFYKNNRPNSGIPLFKIEKDTIWVDDPKNKLYNKKAQLPINCNSYEEMYKINGYEYGIVIDYNTNPVIPNKGSAIFIHIGNKPTKGCIAAKKEDLLYLMKFLDIRMSPHILIV